MDAKTMWRDIVILFLIVAALVICLSYCSPASAMDVPPQDGEEIVDLLWWLRRAGSGALSFMEEMNNLGDGYVTASGYFHHGPSR